MSITLRALVVGVACLGCVNNVVGQESYTPQQVYTVFYDSIRQAFGMEGSPNFLSLTAVGRFVPEKNYAATVSNLANFCPPASPLLPSFAQEPKLDAIYARVLNGAIGPIFKETEDYRQASAVIVKPDGEETEKYKKYQNFRKQHLAALIDFIKATTPEDRLLAQGEMNEADDKWVTLGFKGDIEQAIGTMKAENFNSGKTLLKQRQDTLQTYRNIAVNGVDSFAGSFAAPLSQFQPGPEEWNQQPGWTTVDYATSARFSSYSASSSEKRGFGGLSLGFLNIGGSGSGSSSNTHRVSHVSELKYKLDLFRVGIVRNWLDTSLFFDPSSWTWKTTPGEPSAFPRVAVALNTNGVPVESQIKEYNNQRISFALLPLEGVVARNVEVTATVSNSDYELIKQQSSASGAASLFGIFGGSGGGKWSSTNESDSGTTTTFTVKLGGPVLIGYISQILPLCPNPNLGAEWPTNAWKP